MGKNNYFRCSNLFDKTILKDMATKILKEKYLSIDLNNFYNVVVKNKMMLTNEHAFYWHWLTRAIKIALINDKIGLDLFNHKFYSTKTTNIINKHINVLSFKISNKFLKLDVKNIFN